ncbi:1181_t:CDS:2, partial [Acaulospora morrowiae]
MLAILSFKSFQTCGRFINGIDDLFTFAEKYKYEVKRNRDDINRRKKQTNDGSIEAEWCRATLGTPQFRKLVKRT